MNTRNSWDSSPREVLNLGVLTDFSKIDCKLQERKQIDFKERIMNFKLIFKNLLMKEQKNILLVSDTDIQTPEMEKFLSSSKLMYWHHAALQTMFQ